MILQVEIKDNEYKSWTWIEIGMRIKINSNLNPLELKLFNGDLVEEDGKLINSKYRNTERTLSGILVLDGKTYGRSSNNKPLYKCIPDNKQLPIFLVPYEERNPSFIKKKANNYVLFKFKEWTDKHPIGTVVNTIGRVEDIKAFEEYQLSCKDLNVSLQRFTKETVKMITEQSKKENITDAIIKNDNIEDRRIGYNVFSIDPLGSKDFDDAFSIQIYEKYIIISVYIANVPLIIDYLNLWGEFTNRVSTIYLPGNKKSMLPPILSDDLCSLQEGKERFAFTMDIKILKNDVVENNKELCEIIDIKFSNTLIKLTNNYVYEEPALLSKPNYVILLEYTKHLQKNLPYLDEINDSHDVVAYYMILMNYESSKKMIEYDVGIFRATSSSAKSMEETNENEPPREIKNFIKGWKYEMGGYYCDNKKRKGHELIANGLDSYTHITSPIRRIVDLINLIELQRTMGLFSSSSATLFAEKWLEDIEYINNSSKAIKKVQQNCLLLHTLTNTPQKDVVYKGYVLEKIYLCEKTTICKNKLIKYNVYIPSLKMVSSFKAENEEIQLYTQCEFMLRLIVSENDLRKKIRLQIV
jgi:exoribonuclease R